MSVLLSTPRNIEFTNVAEKSVGMEHKRSTEGLSFDHKNWSPFGDELGGGGWVPSQIYFAM